MAEETPSEGHDKVRKKINVYKTAVDVNKKQKELKKKKKALNTTVDNAEGEISKFCPSIGLCGNDMYFSSNQDETPL